jgi:hypothetical protein
MILFSIRSVTAHNLVRMRRLIPLEALASKAEVCLKAGKRPSGAKRSKETAAKRGLEMRK